MTHLPTISWKLGAIALALFAASASAAVTTDCMIVATELEYAIQAKARLDHINVWSRILLMDLGDGHSHCYCVFQPHKEIQAQDINGAYSLRTHSHNAEDIGRKITRFTGKRFYGARFIN